MGQISTTISVVDKATDKLNRIKNAVNALTNVFQKLDTVTQPLERNISVLSHSTQGLNTTLKVTNRTFDTMSRNMEESAVSLRGVNIVLNETESSFQRVINESRRLRENLTSLSRSTSGLRGISVGIDGIGRAARNSTNSVSTLNSHLKSLAATYLGVMGIREILQTSDTLTAADNKFVTYASQQFALDTTAAEQFSENTLDKIYMAAQKSFTTYQGAITNVSKLLTLAGKSFGNDMQQQTDNAIKFYEVMSKLYALGGASAAEQSSSMYQLVQALGSGILQGDELRSVREGASLAYVGIEKFAQEVLHTEESLKNLASQGLITSDLVVAAVLSMEEQTAEAFDYIKEHMTFAQVRTRFLNDLTKMFEPVFKKLQDIANSKGFRILVERVTKMMEKVSKVILITLTAIEKALNWLGERAEVLDTILNILMTLFLMLATKAIQTTIVKVFKLITGILGLNKGFLLLVGALSMVIFYLSEVGVNAETLSNVMMTLGIAAFAFGLLTQNVFYTIVGIIGILLGLFEKLGGTLDVLSDMLLHVAGIFGILAAVAAALGITIFGLSPPVLAFIAVILLAAWAFVTFTEQVVGLIYWVIEAVKNFLKSLVNKVIDMITLVHSVVTTIALFIEALITGTQEAWDRAVEAMKNTFKRFIGTIVSAMANGAANILEVIADLARGANTLLGGFGVNINANGIDAFANKVRNFAQKYGTPVTLPYTDATEAYTKGAEKGKEIREKIENALQKVRDLLNGFDEDDEDDKKDPIQEAISKLEGLLNTVGNIEDGTGRTAKNTGDMARAMELTEEDLRFLRDIAEREAINRFTTAEIKVDMVNHNEIKNTTDLDGIVIHLNTELRKALQVTANGVHMA